MVTQSFCHMMCVDSLMTLHMYCVPNAFLTQVQRPAIDMSGVNSRETLSSAEETLAKTEMLLTWRLISSRLCALIGDEK